MGVLVNLWTQVRKQLRWVNGGTGNTQGWSTGVIKVCTNRTGSTLALGTIVKFELTYNDARVEPTTSATDPVLGVVVGYWSTDDPNTLILADAPDAHSVAVMTQGTVRVGLDSGGATRGDFAFPSTTSGVASSSASAGTGAFGVFQSTGGNGGTALVVINGTQNLAGGGGGGSYGTPNLTLGTSNSAGAASTGIRTDATILTFDVTTPASLTLGGSGAVGSAGTAARRDHQHAVTGALDDLSNVTAPSPSTNDVLSWNGSAWVPVAPGGASFATPAIALGTAAAAGAASTVIRSDATIVAFDATVPTTIAYGDSASTGAAAVAARRDHKHGAPSGTATAIAAPSDLGIFGNGRDGAVTISGTPTSLSSDMYYTDLTVPSGKSLNTQGYRVFVSGTLTNAGVIYRRPNNGAGGGSGGAGGASIPDANTLGAPAGGSSPVATGNGGAGANSTNVTTSLGGNGGAGGNSSGGQTGGAGGTVGYSQTAYPLAFPACVQLVNWSRATLTAVAPGASGGSGATTNLGRGGGGGSGGGCVVVVAKKIDNTGGVIHARGGDGGAGNSNAANGGGGGGGGGGGVLVVVYNELVAAGTMDAAGGAGGAAGNGAAAAGANGSAGTTIILSMT